MKEKLHNLLKNSYSPYFNFPMASIVVTDDGQEFEGVNVENANGTSICAERNAIANAIAHGYKKGQFNRIYIMSNTDKKVEPCFACRQVLIEFLETEDQVICMNYSGESDSYTIEQLCPHPFDSEDLN